MSRLGWLASMVCGVVAVAACTSSETASSGTTISGTTASVTVASETTASAGGSCPDQADEVMHSDVDGDGTVDRVYLRRDNTGAILIGLCGGNLAVAELDVGGTETSIAGLFDVDQEIFVVDTSAQSVIYSAVTSTPAGLAMTTMLVERTIGTDGGDPFYATSFSCAGPPESLELITTEYEPAEDRERLTASLLGLDGTRMTTTVIEISEVDPAEALAHWNDSGGCFDSLVSFDDATIALEAALNDLGFENLGGDDAGPESLSYVVGRGEVEEVQLTTGWDLFGPQGTFETEPRSDDLVAITRADRVGVWTTCDRLYLESVDLGDTQVASALARELIDVICPAG